MPLDPQAQQTLEEFKEAGQEYRYRDQLMVQEFGLTMAVAGVAIAAITPRVGTVGGWIIQAFGLLFLALLTLHLHNVNQDRRAALARRNTLRDALEFKPIHLNVDGRRRWSAPRLMVWFSAFVTAAWAGWTLFSVPRASAWIALTSN
jgi:hypothetical protein